MPAYPNDVQLYRSRHPSDRRGPGRRRRRRSPLFSLLLAGVLLFGSGFLLGWTVAAAGDAAGDAPGRVPTVQGGFPSASLPTVSSPPEPVPPTVPDWVTVDLLPVNEWSRPGDALERVNGVVVHYVGNPNTTAQQNRSYFARLAEDHETYASSHFLVGMDGAVLQCVPLDEIAYCSNGRNADTISIECCHPDETGEFTRETRTALIRLLDWLVQTYGLQREDVLRHYDVTGKECPRYYVDHPDAWSSLLDSLTYPNDMPMVTSGVQGQDGWALALVNWQTPLPEDFSVPQLTELRNGQAIDSRAYPSLQAMMDAARAQGLDPLICASYRDWDTQQQLFQQKLRSCLDEGMSQAEAEDAAALWVARPGTSEHQLGLAVDIVDRGHQALDETQESTPVQQWLMAHCADYGFILRYPTGKSDLTGIGYEPWHYRYVGVDTARAIMEQGVCLEEYLAAQAG